MSYPKSRIDHLRIADTDDGGMVIYDQTRDDGHLLNSTAATVYQLADGTRSIEAITAQLAARTGVPAESDMVLVALAELNRVGLLESDGGALSRFGFDRRSFLTKLGLMTGAAALVPLIETVTRMGQLAPTGEHTNINQPQTTAPPGRFRTTQPGRLPTTAPPSGGGSTSKTNT